MFHLALYKDERESAEINDFFFMRNLRTQNIHFGDFLPEVLQVKGDMMFELQAFCDGDLTGREQLTAKVDHDQNETFMCSVKVQKHCVVVLFFFILAPFLSHFPSKVIVFLSFYVFLLTW